MVTNEVTLEALIQAAELLYQHITPEGFPSGMVADKNGKHHMSYNNWTGAKEHLEHILNRQLNKAEITMLSLAVGFGPTPNLSQQERDYSMDCLWPKGNPNNMHQELMRLICCV